MLLARPGEMVAGAGVGLPNREACIRDDELSMTISIVVTGKGFRQRYASGARSRVAHLLPTQLAVSPSMILAWGGGREEGGRGEEGREEGEQDRAIGTVVVVIRP